MIWSFRGGLVCDEDKSNISNFQAKKMENWEEQVLHQASSASVMDVKQENSASNYVYGANEDFQAAAKPTACSQVIPASSPKSCVTSFSSNMLDFSTSKGDGRHPPPDRSSDVSESEKGLFSTDFSLRNPIYYRASTGICSRIPSWWPKSISVN